MFRQPARARSNAETLPEWDHELRRFPNDPVTWLLRHRSRGPIVALSVLCAPSLRAQARVSGEKLLNRT